MTRDRLLEIIAEYLNDRDDIARAQVLDPAGVVDVETQGGTTYYINVEAGDE